MYLLVDTSEKSKIHLTLFDRDHVVSKTYPGQNRELLGCIDKMIGERGKGKGGRIKPPSLPRRGTQACPPCVARQGRRGRSITGIAVVVGAGGFTSTRIACVVANTFGYVLQIPLLAVTKDQASDSQKLIPKLLKQPKGQYISATYSGEANIGKRG